MVTPGRTKVGLLFPGQGSQSVGMGNDLFRGFPEAKRTFEEANDALGFDISALCFEGPESTLQLTENAQPAILTVSVAALRVWEKENGFPADMCAGHSVGEYAALVAASALDFTDAVRLARKRGMFMQEAVPPGKGAMAAILGMTRDDVEEICRAVGRDAASDRGGSVVSAANYNAPDQIVISGHTQAVEAAVALARERGAKRAILLNVSAPFHCELMEPAALRLEKELEGIEIKTLKIPVLSNVTGDIVTDHRSVKSLLVRQASRPVQWEGCMRTMVSAGVTMAYELGPGRVLSGLMRRFAPRVAVRNWQPAAP